MLPRWFSRISCSSVTIADAVILPVPVGVVFVPPPPVFNELSNPSTLVVEYKELRPRVDLRLDGLMTPEKTIEVVFDTGVHLSIFNVNAAVYPSLASMRPYLFPELKGRGVSCKRHSDYSSWWCRKLFGFSSLSHTCKRTQSGDGWEARCYANERFHSSSQRNSNLWESRHELRAPRHLLPGTIS